VNDSSNENGNSEESNDEEYRYETDFVREMCLNTCGGLSPSCQYCQWFSIIGNFWMGWV